MSQKELFDQAIKNLKQAVKIWSETEAPKIKEALDNLQNIKRK